MAARDGPHPHPEGVEPITPAPTAPADLDAAYELSTDARCDFERDGHVLLRHVAAPEEVAAYRPLIREATLGNSVETRALDERDTYGKAFIQVCDIWKKDPAVAGFTLARRFARIAAELLGVAAVRLYHDQALFKEPGGGPTPWHQDQYYWPLESDRTVTMWMPLVDIAPDMGGMEFGSGTHRRAALAELAISDESEVFFEQMAASGEFRVAEPVPMAAGDATFHAGWTLHRAMPNTSSQMREAMTIIFFADGTRLVEPRYEERRSPFQSLFAGLKPGDAAASDMTPIVYSGAEAS
jgi:ectoine hydroxylase-related dioxygenase (phytanoyl-CoA dioxygenase family)